MLNSIEVSPALLALWGLCIFISVRTIYRLYFHPLCKIPGPKLTAATHLYEFYYDVICHGKFLFQIEKMHQEYGPIVRINPREVHIRDPSFFDEIYAPSSRRREKDPGNVAMYALRTSMAATVDHEHHRLRRSILNNLFSKRSVAERWHILEERTQKLMHRLEEFHLNKKTIQLDDAFAALTADIISYYAYGRVLGYLEDEQFRSGIRASIRDTTSLCHFNRLFPFFIPLLQKFPPGLMRRLMPNKASLLDLHQSIAEMILQSVEGRNASDEMSKSICLHLNDPSIPLEERTIQRMTDECGLVLGAGGESTARVLTVAAFYLAWDKTILHRLRDELRKVLPTPTSTATWAQLEQLPYLTAVVYEVLRVANPVIGRLPRIAPDETLTYRAYQILPGTPVSTSTYFIHRDPTLFPNPEKFDPERWIPAAGDEEKIRKLKQCLNPFNKGSRICLGLNLAWAELYIAIAYFARRFDIELQNTTPQDLVITREFVLGRTARGDLHVYAKITDMVQD